MYEWEISCKCEIDITSDGLVARFTKTAVPEDGHRVTAETSSGINSILRGTVLCFLGGGGGGGSCTISWGRLGREVHRFRGPGGAFPAHPTPTLDPWSSVLIYTLKWDGITS